MINTNISVLSIKVNSLNSYFRIKRFSNWPMKQNLTLCCIQETYLNHSPSKKLKWQKCIRKMETTGRNFNIKKN